jgi:hypothetical protein
MGLISKETVSFQFKLKKSQKKNGKQPKKMPKDGKLI